MAKKKSRIRRIYSKAKRRVSRQKISILTVASFAPLGFQTVKAWQQGGFKNAVNVFGRSLTGYDAETGKFDWTSMKVGTIPIVGVAVLKKVMGWLGITRSVRLKGIPISL